jgi:hypothetical protein
MTRKLYFAANGASPTTAAQVIMATTAAINTLLQIATPTTTPITILEWGISLDTPASASIVKAELLQTDVAATAGTSLTPTVWGDPNAPASLCVGGTGATMFNDGAITEGTITAARMFDVQVLVPPFVYVKQYPLGREPEVPVSKFLRIRVTASVTVNAYCYIIWEE